MEDLRGLKLTHKEQSIDFDLTMILLIKMSITKQSYHHFNCVCVYVYRRSETLLIFVYFRFCVANMENSIFLCLNSLNVVFFLLPNEIYLNEYSIRVLISK